ncbi:taste receptor type 2 member 1-like [Aquarana catesbeiana]|uniref:taste receptor type 2 member 1-like n=1 Tax=Aquarana catesbeiana TaxID=8400 RepID=UPI003CC97754
MASSFILALTALQVVALLVGFVTNGFILGVNLLDWKQCKALTAADHFICAVGLSNLLLQIWLGFGWMCDLFWNSDLFCRFAYALKMISIQCSLLLSAQLCVFYCIKILTFSHSFINFYKRHFLKSYKIAIISAVILCTVVGGPLFWIGENHLPFPNGSSVFSNTKTKEEMYSEIYRYFVLCYGYTTPLALAIISASLVIISLMLHMNRMRDTLNTKHGAFINTHFWAGVTVLSLLLLYVMCFVTAIFNMIPLFKKGDPGFGLCQLVFMIYAPAHGVVLITGNSKLKNAAAKVKERIVRVLTPKGWIKEDVAITLTQH